MKQAIVALSFGTSYPEAQKSCIVPLEEQLAARWPERKVVRAFTSRIIARKVKEQGQPVDNEVEAVEKLRAEGYDEIAVAVSHLIPGHEYDKLRANLPGITISEPLLKDEEDLRFMAHFLGLIAEEEGRLLLVMGHGTDHEANSVYVRLRGCLPDTVRLACVEGESTLEELLPELDAREDKRVTLMPLMLVAGDHANNDLNGDEEDSWRSILERRGYDVRARLTGLGSYTAIQERFLQKAEKAFAGRITFVGMGPGEPELMTRKAVRLIREADLVAVPENGSGESTVAKIAGELLNGKEVLKLYMPMKGRRESWNDAHSDAVRQLAEALDEGRNIAYLVLGDPLLYATSSYLMAMLKPKYEVCVVPGITTMCAVAAELQIPLCEDREALTVLPGYDGSEPLPTDNVVVMKASRSLEAIEAAAEGRETYLARNLGMDGEYLGSLKDADRDSRAYFSTVLIKPKH